jgi:RNA polymerase sigma factor (sigma-70 family)
VTRVAHAIATRRAALAATASLSVLVEPYLATARRFARMTRRTRRRDAVRTRCWRGRPRQPRDPRPSQPNDYVSGRDQDGTPVRDRRAGPRRARRRRPGHQWAIERRDLGRAFDRLSPDDRALLTMRHLWDAPVAEVAEALGIPAGTVKSRTHAAMERLRAAYDAEARR